MTYQRGDRVLFRTTAGELPATVREASRLPDGRELFLVKPDTGPPCRVALPAQLRPAPAGSPAGLDARGARPAGERLRPRSRCQTRPAG